MGTKIHPAPRVCPEFVKSLLTIAGIQADMRFIPRPIFNLRNVAAAIGVLAQAHDLHLASDAFAVVAAIFLLFGGRAGTGRICAFFGGGCHHAPLPVCPASFHTGQHGE
jgi:hypothetical protein